MDELFDLVTTDDNDNGGGRRGGSDDDDDGPLLFMSDDDDDEHEHEHDDDTSNSQRSSGTTAATTTLGILGRKQKKRTTNPPPSSRTSKPTATPTTTKAATTQSERYLGGLRILFNRRNMSSVQLDELISHSMVFSPATLAAMPNTKLVTLVDDPSGGNGDGGVSGTTVPNFVTVGLVFKNSGTKVSRGGNGSAFCVLDVGSNFQSGPCMSVFLFGDAYTQYMKQCQPGQIIYLQAPRLLPSKQQQQKQQPPNNRNNKSIADYGITFSVTKSCQMGMVGTAQDFGYCKATNVRTKQPDGRWLNNGFCRQWIDKRTSPSQLCHHHRQLAIKSKSAGTTPSSFATSKLSKLQQLRQQSYQVPQTFQTSAAASTTTTRTAPMIQSHQRQHHNLSRHPGGINGATFNSSSTQQRRQQQQQQQQHQKIATTKNRFLQSTSNPTTGRCSSALTSSSSLSSSRGTATTIRTTNVERTTPVAAAPATTTTNMNTLRRNNPYDNAPKAPTKSVQTNFYSNNKNNNKIRCCDNLTNPSTKAGPNTSSMSRPTSTGGFLRQMIGGGGGGTTRGGNRTSTATASSASKVKLPKTTTTANPTSSNKRKQQQQQQERDDGTGTWLEQCIRGEKRVRTSTSLSKDAKRSAAAAKSGRALIHDNPNAFDGSVVVPTPSKTIFGNGATTAAHVTPSSSAEAIVAQRRDEQRQNALNQQAEIAMKLKARQQEMREDTNNDHDVGEELEFFGRKHPKSVVYKTNNNNKRRSTSTKMIMAGQFQQAKSSNDSTSANTTTSSFLEAMGGIPIDEAETEHVRNAKSRFCNELKAEEYVKRRQRLRELERLEASHDQNAGTSNKNKNDADKPHISKTWLCGTCGRSFHYRPKSCFASNHDITIRRDISASKSKSEKRLKLNQRSAVDGGLQLGSGLEWSRSRFT